MVIAVMASVVRFVPAAPVMREHMAIIAHKAVFAVKNAVIIGVHRVSLGIGIGARPFAVPGVVAIPFAFPGTIILAVITLARVGMVVCMDARITVILRQCGSGHGQPGCAGKQKGGAHRHRRCFPHQVPGRLPD